MSSLLLFRNDEQCFDTSSVEEAFAKAGVLEFADICLERAALAGVFRAEGDEVIVRLDEGLQFIAVSDSGAAGARFALALQKALPEPLRLIDEGYSFDTLVSDHLTVDSLLESMQC